MIPVAIGQTRKLAWLARITWRAATLSLALPLAATFAGLNPPWATWCGFAVIYMLIHGCAVCARAAAFGATQRPVMAAFGPVPRARSGGHLHLHELVEPVTFQSPTCP